MSVTSSQKSDNSSHNSAALLCELLWTMRAIMRAIMDFAIMGAKSIIALGAIIRAIMRHCA